jgi:hypothetical protein
MLHYNDESNICGVYKGRMKKSTNPLNSDDETLQEACEAVMRTIVPTSDYSLRRF